MRGPRPGRPGEGHRLARGGSGPRAPGRGAGGTNAPRAHDACRGSPAPEATGGYQPPHQRSTLGPTHDSKCSLRARRPGGKGGTFHRAGGAGQAPAAQLTGTGGLAPTFPLPRRGAGRPRRVSAPHRDVGPPHREETPVPAPRPAPLPRTHAGFMAASSALPRRARGAPGSTGRPGEEGGSRKSAAGTWTPGPRRCAQGSRAARRRAQVS